jgi:Tol biopolymer transport system component
VKIILLTVFGFIFYSCANNSPSEKNLPVIHYPEPLPDSLPLIFLPKVVSGSLHDFNAAFSPDGLSFYFTRSENSRYKIYVTQYANGIWKNPVQFSATASDYSEADPAFGPDGKLYFISNRPKNKPDSISDYDIWCLTPEHNGWSAAKNMEAVNSDSADYYISFSENGNLYFASSRNGSTGEEDIYRSRFINDHYGIPENLGPAINSEKSEYDPFISPKEDFIIFTSSNRSDTFGGADLYFSKSDTNEQWLQAGHLSKKFNTSTRDYCAYITPDWRYFFFSSADDIKWVRAKHLTSEIESLNNNR